MPRKLPSLPQPLRLDLPSVHESLANSHTRITRGLLKRLASEGASTAGLLADSEALPGPGIGRPVVRTRQKNAGIGTPSNGESGGAPATKMVQSYDALAAEKRPTGGGGLLRCICETLGVSPKDDLLQCTKCHNWCHMVCVGVGTDVAYLTRNVGSTFVCPFCTDAVGSKRRRVPEPSLQQTVRLQEFPDREPENAAQLDKMIATAEEMAHKWGYDLLALPEEPLTDNMILQAMECCKSAIANATFSPSYPLYCLKEHQQCGHRYLQGAMLRHRASNVIVSMVLSNGMDPYGNLKQSLSHLRASVTRFGLLPGWLPGHHALLGVSDFSEFVHLTLVATSDEFRGKDLAKLLVCYDTLRWLRRGRTKAFVNMALEKKPKDRGAECFVPAASSGLYGAFGYFSVYPREPSDARVTTKEADMGRTLINMDIGKGALAVAESLGLTSRGAHGNGAAGDRYSMHGRHRH